MPSRTDGLPVRLGVGIQDMRERITQLGGRFEVRSSEKGTTIVATVPMPNSSAPTTA